MPGEDPIVLKGVACIVHTGLVSQATGNVQTNPTIAEGDFRISKYGGTLVNLATLPAVTPAGGKIVRISLSADEKNADRVNIVGSDQAGAEWYDFAYPISTI